MPLMSVNETTAGNSTGISTETVVQTLPVTVTGRGDQGTLIRGYLIVSPGTGATGVTITCRAGTTVAGTQIDRTIAVSGLTAGLRYAIPVGFLDLTNLSDQPGGTQYVLTTIQTGAPTAAGSVTGGLITVET